MSRSVPEWCGATPDTPAPPRVRLRVLERHDRNCAWCGYPITGKYETDHATPLIAGGKNIESNLQPLHIACHAQKTGADVAAKSKSARVMKAHYGVSEKKRPFPGGRNDKYRKRMNGRVELREPR